MKYTHKEKKVERIQDTEKITVTKNEVNTKHKKNKNKRRKKIIPTTDPLKKQKTET